MALSSAQKGESNGRLGLGREEQIPALVQPRRNERSKPFTPQEYGVRKRQTEVQEPALDTGQALDTHHTTAQHLPQCTIKFFDLIFSLSLSLSSFLKL